MELFKSMTGIDIVHVPYKGGPPAATDLIAGQIALLFFTPAGGAALHQGRQAARARCQHGETLSHCCPTFPR